MNPQPPFPPHDDLEARITALLLGELPETEAAALRREIAASAALQKLHDELARTIGLVREARGAADEKTGRPAEPLTLSSDKRDRLLAAFKTVPLPVAGKKRRLVAPWREAASVAAMLAVLAGVTTLVLNRGLQPEDTLSDRMALFFGREKFYEKRGGVTPLPMMDTAWSDQSQTVRLFASDAASSSLDVRAARVEAEFAAARGSVPPSGQVPLLNPAGEPVVNDPIVVMRKRVDREVEEMDAEWKTRGGNDLKALLKEPAPAANDYGGNASGTPALTVADSRTAPERPVTRFAIALPTAPEQAKAGADDFNALSRGGTPALGVENRWASSSATAFDEAPVASTFFRQTGQPQSLAQTDLSRRADAAGAKDGSTWEFRSSGRAREQVAMQSESKVAAAGDLFGDADRYAAAVPPPSKPLGSVAPEGMKANYGNNLANAQPSGGGLGGGAAGGDGRGLGGRQYSSEAVDELTTVPASPVAVSGPAPAQAAKGRAWFEEKPVAEGEKQVLVFQGVDRKDSFGTELKTRVVTVAGEAATVLSAGTVDPAVEFNQPAPAPMAAYRVPVAARGYFFDASGPAKGAKAVDKELADQPMPVGAVMLGDNVESRVQQLQEVEAVRLVNQSGPKELYAKAQSAAPASTLDLSTINGRELGLEQLSAPGAHGDFILSKSKNQAGGNVGDPQWIGTLESAAKSDVKAESLRRLGELSVDEGLQVVDGERSVIKRSIVLPASGTVDSGVIVAGKPATAETSRKLAKIATSSSVQNLQLAALKQVEQRAKADGVGVVPPPSEPGGLAGNSQSQREVDLLSRLRAALQLRIEQEKELANSAAGNAMVKIVDQAKADSAPKQSLLGRAMDSLTGSERRTVRVAVDKDRTDIQGLAGSDTGQVSGYDPYFLATEQEVITSRDVLSRAISSLTLAGVSEITAVGGENGINKLGEKISVSTIPNTSLLEISVKDANPETAAKLANAVATAYRQKRIEDSLKARVAGVAELQKRLDQIGQQLALAKQQVPAPTEAAAEVDAPAPRTAAPNAAVPQPEVATAENAFSTFSLNVADVSFKLTAASLEKGAMPDVSTIRSEEFINAFDYRDPEPPAGVPIAFATERARYPFAHDRDLVRFSVKTAAVGRQPGKPFNIVLAIDNSGSMERADRVRILQECIRTLGSQLLPEDRISVVSFARTARLWVDGLPAGQAGNLAERVGQLAPEGGTNLEEAMNIAYKTALRHFVPGGVNRVVLITDGAANLGEVEPDSLKQKVEAFRKQGIALDCFGIGWDGFNDDLLEVLSRNGDGRYGFINTPEAAATEFAGQLAGALKVAASDVKVQVEWNPRRVTSYRQIGYAKHQLKKEQFRDNTVDAAEIGAAEAGNALYSVQVNPAGEGPLGTVRVRFRVPNTSDYREHEWIVPYATPAPALDQASSTLRLAATASAFSEWLVASPFAAEVTPDKLLGYLRGVPEMRPADPRPKQLETMIRQAKTISGQ